MLRPEIYYNSNKLIWLRSGESQEFFRKLPPKVFISKISQRHKDIKRAYWSETILSKF